MKNIIALLIFTSILVGCQSSPKSFDYNSVTITPVYEDSVSIRAIEFLDSNTLAFAGSKGSYGTVEVNSGKVRANTMKYHTSIPEFRSVGHTATDFFMLSVASPALLYKTGDEGRMDLVYKEEGDNVFYDAMKFWNDSEGIAVGDSVDGCLSIIITRDGGNTWTKLACDSLPEGITGEGAFAASNTNIEIVGDHTWIATTQSRILYSSNKGQSWQLIKTPMIYLQDTEGIYSIDFYDENLGFAIGGDFTKPLYARANKAITKDGGKTWNVVADGKRPGYKSCVQFIPNSGGNDLIAIGADGIWYSKNTGTSWQNLSKEGFYTIRFLNDSVAYAAGNNRIAKLVFK